MKVTENSSSQFRFMGLTAALTATALPATPAIALRTALHDRV